MITPRAWPTWDALRAFWPKERAPAATAAGSCPRVRARARAGGGGGRSRGGGLAVVPSAPRSGGAGWWLGGSPAPSAVWAVAGAVRGTPTCWGWFGGGGRDAPPPQTVLS